MKPANLLTLSPVDFCSQTNACDAGATFAKQFSTMAKVWDACPRADWLLWILKAIGQTPDDKTCRKLACFFVRHTPLKDRRTVWDLLTDDRSRQAVIVAERFADGLATAEERATAYASAADAAAYAAYAAADAAYAARLFQANHLRTVIANPFKK